MCLKSILKIKNGTDYKKVENKKGKYGVYGTGGLITHTDNFLIDKPTVCIGRKGTINRPMFFNTPIWTVDTLFYSDIKNADPRFVFYLFQTINWNKYNQSTGVPSLTSEGIEKINSFIPNSITEEKRISSFLSLIDKRINILSNKISILKKYKEGLDQTAFTEGSTIKLGSLIEQLNIRNKSLKKIHIFSISNQFGFIPHEDIFLGKTISLKNKKNYKIVEKYQFAYNPARINVGSIACQTYDIGQVSPMYIVFKTERNNVEILNEWFHSRFFIKEINSNLEGSVRKILTFENLSNLLIKWPKDRLIYSRAFTKVNLKINLLLQQLNDLKMLKKYLLNKLFV